MKADLNPLFADARRHVLQAKCYFLSHATTSLLSIFIEKKLGTFN